MAYENGNIGGELYHINRKLQPHTGLYPHMQEENEMFAKVSRTAKGVSHKLSELHSKIHDRDTLKRTLEEELKQAQGVFKNDAEIDVVVTLGLNNGISFNTSGDFESAYDSLNPKLREIYSKPSNIEIREALKNLVYNGLVIEAHHGNVLAIVGSSNVDPYLNNSTNHHSLREKLHLGHPKK